MKPVVLIVGQSGSGKSSTFRNLDPTKTVIVNTERKVMPYKSFKKFKNINVAKYKDFRQLLTELKKDTIYEYVVIDSLTSLTEIIQKYCDSVFSGYEKWSQYNEAIQDTLWSLKDLGETKQVFVTGIPNYLETEPGESKAFVKVKGKEWLYSIEKEFAIVLHTQLVENDDGEIDKYLLKYKPNKHDSSKAPHEMFEGELVNDAVIISDAINAYYDD